MQFKTPGKHTIGNALAAATVGLHFGVSPRSIKSALENYRSEKSRMEVTKIKGVTILDDTYNANPDSVREALRTLAEINCNGKKIVVLGDMLELGPSMVGEHLAVGTEIKRLGFEYVLTYGKGSAAIVETAGASYGFHYEEKSTLTAYLEELVMPGDAILVKGSRGMKMEEVVIHLTDHLRSRR